MDVVWRDLIITKAYGVGNILKDGQIAPIHTKRYFNSVWGSHCPTLKKSCSFTLAEYPSATIDSELRYHTMGDI